MSEAERERQIQDFAESQGWTAAVQAGFATDPSRNEPRKHQCDTRMRTISPTSARVGGKNRQPVESSTPKRKSKMKTKTKPVAVENPLASLGLTARETEVLTWIAQGKTNYEIGVILSASTGTICKKLNASCANSESKIVRPLLPSRSRYWPREKE